MHGLTFAKDDLVDENGLGQLQEHWPGILKSGILTRNATLATPQVYAMPSVHVGAWAADAQISGQVFPSNTHNVEILHDLDDTPRQPGLPCSPPRRLPTRTLQLTYKGLVSCTTCCENAAVNAAAPNFVPRWSPPALREHQIQISQKTGLTNNSC